MEQTKKQKEKIAKVMHEFKEGELHIGKSDKIVKNPKQAVAIALSQANASKKMANGGGVDEMPNEITGLDNIKYIKVKTHKNSDGEIVTNYQAFWNGYLIEDFWVGNLRQLNNFINDFILSNSQYNKLSRLPKKDIKIMADGGKVGEDFKFNYMMLDRLQSDNDYYLKHPDEQNLWAGSVDKQISEMKKLWNQLPKDKKPEWLSMEDILEYEKKMKKNYANGGSIGECYYTIGGL